MFRDSLLKTPEVTDTLNTLYSYTASFIDFINQKKNVENSELDTVLLNLYKIYDLDKDLAISLLKKLDGFKLKEKKILNYLIIFSFYNQDSALLIDTLNAEMKNKINNGNTMSGEYLNELISFTDFLSWICSADNTVIVKATFFDQAIFKAFLESIRSIFTKIATNKALYEVFHRLALVYTKIIVAMDDEKYLDHVEHIIKEYYRGRSEILDFIDVLLNTTKVTTDKQMIRRSQLVIKITKRFEITFNKWSIEDKLYNMRYVGIYAKSKYIISDYDENFLAKNEKIKGIINSFLQQIVYRNKILKFDLNTQRFIINTLIDFANINPVYLSVAENFCRDNIKYDDNLLESRKNLLFILQIKGNNEEYLQLYEEIYGSNALVADLDFYLRINQVDIFYKEFTNYYEKEEEKLLEKSEDLFFLFHLLQLCRNKQRYQFYYDSWQILERVPQPKKPKGVIVVLESTLCCLPMLCKLRKQGYATVFSSEGIMPASLTNNKDIDHLHGIIGSHGNVLRNSPRIKQQLKKKWQINLAKEQVICEGINYYHGIYESLARYYRRSQFNYKHNIIINTVVRTNLVMMDNYLTMCDLMYEDIAKKHNLPIHILGMQAASLPMAPYRQFCDTKGKKVGMQCYMLSPGYENYYSNLKSCVATTLAICNLTKDPKRRYPMIAQEKKFLAWKAKNKKHFTKYKEKVAVYLQHNRTLRPKKFSDEAAIVLEKIKDFKKKGKSVVLAFGKLTCDFAVPYDGGPAHKNMKDWINHTIKLFRNSDNLLLIKPHPYEKRSEINVQLTEYFTDLIEEEISDNIIILDNNWFNNNDLYKYLNVGILWNGTSMLELGANEIPVIACSYFGNYDYPIKFNYPKNRKDYENMIKKLDEIKAAPNVKEDSTLLLHYLTTEDICVDYEYLFTPTVNNYIGERFWYMNKIEQFFKNGDKNIDKIVARITGKM